jgi:hypothetical protein
MECRRRHVDLAVLQLHRPVRMDTNITITTTTSTIIIITRITLITRNILIILVPPYRTVSPTGRRRAPHRRCFRLVDQTTYPTVSCTSALHIDHSTARRLMQVRMCREMGLRWPGIRRQGITDRRHHRERRRTDRPAARVPARPCGTSCSRLDLRVLGLPTLRDALDGAVSCWRRERGHLFSYYFQRGGFLLSICDSRLSIFTRFLMSRRLWFGC